MRILSFAAFAATITLLPNMSALAADDTDIQALRMEIQAIRQSYESRIAELENKLATVDNKIVLTQTAAIPASQSPSGRRIYDNNFNPSIGLILNGRYSNFSEESSNIAGFGVPGEGARSSEGLKLGESEFNVSSNIDDKFFASLTTAFVNEDGEDGIEIEEAFVQTLPGMGLPKGMSIKGGRALWTLGYLNEQHAHTDDFADRPLPYRVFFNNAYNDDGAEVSYVLPTDFYSEIGGGVFRGDDYPFGSARGGKIGAWSAFARVGGDIGDDQSWRLGGYVLSGDTSGRSSNDDVVNFAGENTLYSTDFRYAWTPTGNSHEKELILQGEYFWRSEKGTYEDTSIATGAVAVNDPANGWYTQAVYKFHPNWRVGARYSQLNAPDIPTGLLGSLLDSGAHNPKAYAVMMDWTNSEFSRFRLQYNLEELSKNQEDNQIMLQYIMSIGAHAAHKY